MKSNLPPEQRISKLRARLLINNPWFGQLALRMRIIRSEEVPTMANNGTILYYNENYLDSLTDTQLMGVIAHEVMHCALGHMFREGNRDHYRWNEAADLAINNILRNEKFELPYTGYEEEEKFYAGMHSEQIYALRQQKDQTGSASLPSLGGGQSQVPDPHHGQHDCGLQKAPQHGSGSGDKSQKDAGAKPAGKQPDSNDAPMSEVDWQLIAQQAAIAAKRAGKLPAGLERLIEASHQAKTDWRSILRRFITNTLPSDYSWSRPNRRFVSDGLYLPGVMKENAPRFGVAVDTSGSIGNPLLECFAAELTAIVREVRPERVDVVYFDTQIAGEESFTPDDPAIVLHAKGGGGTDFRPALEHFAKQPEKPACVIYLTDGYASWPEEPDFPVLWAITESSSINKVPWGEFIKISEHD